MTSLILAFKKSALRPTEIEAYRLPSCFRAFAPTKGTVVSLKPWVLAFPGTKEVTRVPQSTPAPVPLADPLLTSPTSHSTIPLNSIFATGCLSVVNEAATEDSYAISLHRAEPILMKSFICLSRGRPFVDPAGTHLSIIIFDRRSRY